MGATTGEFKAKLTQVAVALAAGGLMLSVVTACSDNGDDREVDVSAPLLTSAQHQVDQVALDLLKTSEVTAAREQARGIWSALPAYQLADGKATLDAALDEAQYLAVRAVAADDPVEPTLIWTSGPGYSWGATQVPGSRWGGDNPDRIYRTFAVRPEYRYEIHGQRDAKPSEPDFSFEVIPTASLGENVLATLNSKDIDIDAAGTFTVTVDSTPANGRRNHLRLPPGSMTVTVRDTLADWSAQLPNHLTVQRVGDPAQNTKTPEQLRKQAADEVVRVARANAGFIQYGWSNPINGRVSNVRRPDQGVPGSVGAMSQFRITPDEALIFTVAPETAGYINVQLTDPWFRSVPYWNKTSSLSNEQAKSNPDGTYTFVVSSTDPGYYNWLDTGGLSAGLYLMRIEDFGTVPANPSTVIREPQLVPLTELPAALPASMLRVTPAERSAQLSHREAGYEERAAR